MSLNSQATSPRLKAKWAIATTLVTWAVYLLVLCLAWQAALAAGIDGAIEDDRPGSDGLLVQEVQSGSPAQVAGLRPGDHIVAIDNVSFTTGDVFLSTLSQIRPGHRYAYSILPAGTRDPAGVTDLSVVPEPLLDDPFTLTMFSVFTLAGAFTLVIATFVLLARPALEAARVLFVIGAGAAAMLAFAIWSDVGFNFAATWAHYLLSAIVSAALLHLFLVFPARHDWLARLALYRWPARYPDFLGLAVLYGGSVAAAVAVGAPSNVLGWIYALDAFIFGAGLVPLIAAYRHPSSPQGRAQLRWIMWAFALLVFSVLASVVVPLILFGQYPFISVGIVTVVWCAFPLSIAFGVLRYRLFDVDAVLRATFVYGVLTAVLVLAYVAAAFVLGRLVASMAGSIAGSDPSVSLVAALAVAALAHPLRLRVQDTLDRLVYRHKVARRRFGVEANDWLAQARPLQALATLLTVQAPARLGLIGAGLVLTTGMEQLPDPANTLPGVLPASPEGLGETLARLGGSAIVADAEPWPGDIAVVMRDDPAVQPWYAAGARLLVPLGSGENDDGAGRRLVGVWALGDRASGELFDREDLRIADRIGQQAAVLLDYLRLGRVQAHQEVVRRELQRAREIQQRLLPLTLPAWPGQLDLAARLRPALETSGDFYDVRLARSTAGLESLQLVVADVAGKGIGAALVMALARATLRASSDALNDQPGSTTVASPAAILRRAGAILHDDLGVSNFVACTLAIFERRSGPPCLRLSNAGQVFPLLCHNGQTRELDPGGDRLPLGISDRPAYAEAVVELAPGDVLVFVTDGLPDAPLHGQHRAEVFGFERLAASTAHRAQSTRSAAELLDGLWSDMTSWMGGDPEHDDVTVVVARVPGEAATLR